MGSDWLDELCVCISSTLPYLSLSPQSLDYAVFGTLALMPGQVVLHVLLPRRCLGHECGPDILNWFSKVHLPQFVVDPDGKREWPLPQGRDGMGCGRSSGD